MRGVARPAGAQVAPAATPPAQPGSPRPPRQPGRIGSLHVGQVVCWQAAIALVVAALGRPVPVLVGAIVLALLLLIPTTLRVRGRWLYQWTGVYLRYRARARTLRVSPGADPRAALLHHVAPGGTVGSVELDGETLGLVEHAGGVCAILESAAGEGELLSDSALTLPSPAGILPLSDPDGPAVTAQVVIQTVPAPFAQSDAPVVASYRALTGGRVPASRRTWFVLQMGKNVAGYPDDELRKTLTSAVRRLLRRLRKEMIPVRTLDPDEVLSVLATLAHLDAGAPGQGPPHQGGPTARETWRGWSSVLVSQVCFRVRSWPDLRTPEGRQFFGRLIEVPSLATTVAIASRRVGSELEVETAVRLAAPDAAQLAASTGALLSQARACGASLERLDGEHVHGLAASLPLGGFLP